MSKISFEQAMKDFGEKSNNNTSIGFFSLKNDGNEAIVRFMHDTTESFDMHSTHPVKVNDRYTGYASCLRSSLKDPIEKCPLCQNKININNNIFIHLIQYIKDESTGSIIAQPKIWVRNVTYARTLSSLMNEYGPLSESIFKIRRNGAAGSRDTTYDIMYCRPDIYNENVYPKHLEFFKDYTVLDNIVKNYTYSDLNFYVLNNRLPNKEVKSEETNSSNTGTVTYTTTSNAAPFVSVNDNYNHNVSNTPRTEVNTSGYIDTTMKNPSELFSNGIRRYE